MSLSRGTRLIERAGNATWSVPRVVLAVEQGADAGLEWVVGPHAVEVGTHETSTIRLRDTAVSAHHAEIRVADQGVHIRDLGSKNGTFVNGVCLVDGYLPENAKIRLGETHLTVKVTAEDEQVELSRALSFGSLLGHSPAMRAVFAVLEKAAKSDATVLITGESGTGKELAARAVHDKSNRAGGPFVIFDCGAVAPSLVGAHLFGHAKGAFTGATDAREGVFEAANGGTLVLDELGELPLEVQPQLLRALESRMVTRLGETKARPFDARFIASTHRNLEGEVKAGRFRQDLYYRIGVVMVKMPSLRERKEEISRLFKHFLYKLAGENAPDVNSTLLQMLAAHDWPGNVRELRNFAERYVVLGDLATQTMSGSDTPKGVHKTAAPAAAVPFHDAKRDTLEAFEKSYFEDLFRKHGNNLSEAARVAGLSRQTCYRMMRKHGLDVDGD
ncbi:MAG: sigma 54-dependent Fis family transcriptional regulator [Polyangiaceae bacterium]|nr:sigma 54-dependent Fis family transcriptional regulator [Polyangiaceae bacterium]